MSNFSLQYYVLHNHPCILSCNPLPHFSCQQTGCIKQFVEFSCANEQQESPLLLLRSELIQALEPQIYGKLCTFTASAACFTSFRVRSASDGATK